jgi:pyruvate/2-oxoglutarate/acetoin dehydrogenase E1 component
MRDMAYWQAINEALEEEMRRDKTVFVMGEDVAVYGGAYGVTRGLMEKFGEERVRDTAISEAAIVGAGIGAAVAGMRPVVEIMYVDFMGIVMDQLNNQAAKLRYMFGGKCKVPMVIRTEGGAGRTLGAHHSQSLESWFIHIPGIKVVMPSTPHDAKGLLKSAIRDDNPVVYIEHKMLYGTKGPVGDGDYTIPIGVADVKRPGSDLTLITYSRMTLYAIEAAKKLEEEGIRAEVLDLRSLLPMDVEAMVRSIRKTHRAIIVEEDTLTGGTGAEVSALIMEHAFDWLDHPVVRLAGADVPMPKSHVLEAGAIPSVASIVATARRVMGRES